MNTNNLLVAVIAVILIGGTALYLHGGPQGYPGQNGVNGQDGQNGVNFGSVVGPVVDGSDFSVGGLNFHAVRRPLLTGTTTQCSLKGPDKGGTLIRFVINISTPNTTTTRFDVATSSNSYATTTYLGGFTANATQAAAFVLQPTATSSQLFATSTWITAGMFGVANPSVTGSCSGLWLEY